MVTKRIGGSTLIEAIVASVITVLVIVMGATMLALPGRANREVVVVAEFTMDSLWSLPLNVNEPEQEHLFPWGRCLISVEPYAGSMRLYIKEGIIQSNSGVVLSRRKEVINVEAHD